MNPRIILKASMKSVKIDRRKLARRGAVAVLVAFLMIPLLGMAALAVDLGYAYVVQAELQAAADSAALAAAGEMSRASTDVYTQTAIDTAKMYASDHSSLGMTQTLVLDEDDIEFGDATYDNASSKWTFVPGSSSAAPYAIRVTVRRDGATNPLVPRFFSKIFGASDGVQTATASAMITPRDIALIVDLSQSMTFDSMFLRRNDTQINLRDVWVTLKSSDGSPATKVVDGQTFVKEYELRTPANSVYATYSGDTFGSMTEWGSELLQGQYNQTELAADPGMYYLPDRANCPSGGWTSTLGGTSDARYLWLVDNLSNPRSLASRGHSATQITNLLKKPASSESSTTYQNRVKVALGLAVWNDTGNNTMENSEVTTDVDEPYATGADWNTWITDVNAGNGLTYNSSFGGATYFRHYYGLKSYVNWLMDSQFAKTAPVPGSSGYTPKLQYTVAEPVQSVKDAIQVFADYLKDVESNDNVGLVVYGTTGASDPYSETNGLSNDFDTIGNLPYPHQAGESGRYTNTAEPLLRGFMMIHGTGSRPHAHKVIVFMSDGYTTAYNNFDVITDLTSQVNITTLNGISDLAEFEALFGGIPSASIQVGANGSAAAESGRLETIDIANLLASNLLGLGDVEFNVVGVGSEADIQNLLQPIAQASGGDAYYAAPDVNDPSAMQETLKTIYRKIGGKRPVALIDPGTLATANAQTNGNNGVGNGEDPAPPGAPPVNDGAGTSPGDPGNQGGA